jgi:hypothetical protein
MGYSLDGQANATVAGNMTLHELPNGLHNLIVYANDTAGNWNRSSGMLFFTVDTVPPVITFESPTKYQNISSTTVYFNITFYKLFFHIDITPILVERSK